MGAVFHLKCHKCTYELSCELWFAHGYREKHNTLREISEGLWGSDVKNVILDKQNHINIEEHMLVCESCRTIDIRPALSYRICHGRIDKEKIRDIESMKEEIERHKREDYSEPIMYSHMCNKCDVQMREIVNPETEGPIFCPQCGDELCVRWGGVS